MRYIGQKLPYILARLWDINGQIMGYNMGYNRQKLLDILGKTYGIY